MRYTMKVLLSRFFLYFCIATVLGFCGFSDLAWSQTSVPSPEATSTNEVLNKTPDPDAATTAAKTVPTGAITATSPPTMPVPVSTETTSPVKEKTAIEPTPLATPAVQSGNQDAQVTLLKQAVFYIYADHSLYSAAQRARLISERLAPLLQRIEDHPIEVTYRNDIAVLVRDKQELMTITPADAQAAQ